MKKYLWLILPFLFSYMTLISCKKNSSGNVVSHINPSMIYGTWTMEVANGNLKGNEEIIIFPSNNLKVNDSLIFSGEDSGFEFTVPVNVNLNGTWNLEADSLFIKYKIDSINIGIDEMNMLLKNSHKEANLEAFNSLKKEMGEKLSTFVYSILSESYENISNKNLFFGKILLIKKDSLLLNNNNNSFYLTRISNQ